MPTRNSPNPSSLGSWPLPALLESEKAGVLRRAVFGGGGVRVEASKHFEKTEKRIVLFWSLELHSMYWPHIEL